MIGLHNNSSNKMKGVFDRDFGWTIATAQILLLLLLLFGTTVAAEDASYQGLVSVLNNRRLLELTPCDTVLLSIRQEDIDDGFDDLVDQVAPDTTVTIGGFTVPVATAVKILFANKKHYGVEVRKVCASCRDEKGPYEDLYPNLDNYCGDSIYGSDSISSGLLTYPLEAQGSIRKGLLSTYVYSRPTTAGKTEIPSGTVEEFGTSYHVSFGIIASVTHGMTSVTPDFMGYGNSDTYRSYVIKDAYATATIPLILKAKTFLREETDCGTDLGDSAVYLGYSEGGYASVALANGLGEAMGWKPALLQAGGGPYDVSGVLLYDTVKNEQSILTNNRDQKYYSVLLGAAYSSTNSNLANFQQGQDLFKSGIRDLALGWLADPEMTQSRLNDLIDAQEEGGNLNDVWNPDFLTLVRGAIANEDVGFCQPGYSGYIAEKHGKLCEALMQNDVTNVLVEADYPVLLCHSINDEIVTYRNVPDVNLNPNYLTLETKTSPHSDAGFECLVDAIQLLASGLEDYLSPTQEVPTGTCATSLPSASPSWQPSENVFEDADFLFLYKKKRKDLTIETCDFLQSQSEAKRRKICGASPKYQIRSKDPRVGPASVVCYDSCADVCVREVKRNKFLWKAKTSERTKSCKWLQKQDPEKIQKICAKNVVFEGGSIYGQASEVCTATCNSCPASSSIGI